MKRASIRPALFLLLTLALAAPTLENIVNGSESATGALVHLAGAIIVARLSVTMIGHVVDSYRVSAARKAQAQQGQAP